MDHISNIRFTGSKARSLFRIKLRSEIQRLSVIRTACGACGANSVVKMVFFPCAATKKALRPVIPFISGLCLPIISVKMPSDPYPYPIHLRISGRKSPFLPAIPPCGKHCLYLTIYECSSYLLPSRLYCWSRSLTGSAAEAGRGLYRQ